MAFERILAAALVCVLAFGVLNAAAQTPDPVTIDQLLASCPSLQDIASIDSNFSLGFEADPTAGTLVCTAANGSKDLTRLKKNIYQILLAMRQISFDVPFPWTTKNLYDWLKGAIHGIRLREDINFSFCCDPPGVINLQTTTNSFDVLTERWVDPRFTAGLVDTMLLVVHEARHSEGLPHTCGPSDLTIAELGAWGVEYYVEEWLAYHSGPFLTPTDPSIVGGGTDSNGNPLSSSYYRLAAWVHAQSVRDTRFCTQATFLGAPVALDFGNQSVGTTSVARAIALTAGTATAVGISNIVLTGSDAGDFVLNVVSCQALTVPPSCVLTVSFSPAAIGRKTAEIRIFDSAPGSPHHFPLSGTATGVIENVISGLPLPGCTLWPPNHKFVHVATVTASDKVGVSSFNVTVTSNEPSDPGDPDIVITGSGLGPRIVQLRADRLGTGTGRIYTITATATNSAGLTTAATARCTVPHDQGK